MRRRVTQLTKNGFNAQQQSLHDCKIPQKISKSWQIHCIVRLSLGWSTQIWEVKYKQAYKMIGTGVLVWKSKNIKPYQPTFFTLVTICIKLDDELMCFTESLNLNAKWCWECLQEGGWKLSNPISIRWLGHPNPNSLLLHYRSISCLNTLVGSGLYLITLLKHRLFHYIVELYPTFYIAELWPMLIHCWGIPYLITLLSNSQKLIHCWAEPNPNTLLRYSLS